MATANPRVLVVEDDEGVRGVLRDILARVPCEVVEAGDGKTALALLQKETFSAVLLDLLLPEMRGEDVLAQVNADPRFKGLKVLVNSTEGDLRWTRERLGTFTNLEVENLPRSQNAFDIIDIMRRMLNLPTR